MIRLIRNLIVLFGFFFWGFFTGCSSIEREHDPEFEEMIKNFSGITKVPMEEIRKVDVKFYTLGKSTDKARTIGTCWQDKKLLRIDPKYYFKAPYVKKLSLIYHELVHCVCNFEHDDSIMEDGCKASIMHSTTLTNKCLNKHWDKYMEDLKWKCEK